MQLCDFDWRKHPAGLQGVGLFENGFGVSVIPEPDNIHYEVAILEHRNGRHSHLCYTSGLTSDVFRWCDEDAVHDMVFRARNLPVGTRVDPEPEPLVS
jgi:hypothetical protein